MDEGWYPEGNQPVKCRNQSCSWDGEKPGCGNLSHNFPMDFTLSATSNTKGLENSAMAVIVRASFGGIALDEIMVAAMLLES